MSPAIASAVADHEGVDVGDLAVPLGETVNPEALADLFQGRTGLVTFEYHGSLVVVDRAYNVEARPLSSHLTRSPRAIAPGEAPDEP